MREFIDNCSTCGKPVYCENGFFNGEQLEDGKLLCPQCIEEEAKKE